MRDFSRRSLLSFILKSFWLNRILRKPITALPGGIFHSSPVLTASWVKKPASLYTAYLSGVTSVTSVLLLSAEILIRQKAEDKVLVYCSIPIFRLLLPWRISREQLYSELLSGASLGRSAVALREQKATAWCIVYFLFKKMWSVSIYLYCLETCSAAQIIHRYSLRLPALGFKLPYYYFK